MGVEVAAWFWVTSAPFFRPLFHSSVSFTVWVGGVGGIRTSYSCCVHAQTAGTYSAFAFLYNILSQGFGTRLGVTSIHARGDHAQNAGISCISPFCTTYVRKDVEQDSVSQVTSILACGDHAQSTVISCILPFCTTYCARMWNKTRCHRELCPSA